MSQSSLWVMDGEYMGSEVCEFNNSWLFSPIVWDVLLEKYLPYRRLKLLDGELAGFMSSVMSDKKLNSDLNEKINNCDCLQDRVCWEMSNQQVFFGKDKELISKAIEEFLEINKKYQDGILEKKHISERFKEIADTVAGLDEKIDKYFIFKNTNCDDNVEYWFSQYNEEEEEYESRPLSGVNKRVTEFVYIKDGTIEFVSNLDYFEGVKKN